MLYTIASLSALCYIYSVRVTRVKLVARTCAVHARQRESREFARLFALRVGAGRDECAYAGTRIYASVVRALSRGIELYNNHVFSVAKKRLLILSVKMQSTRKLCYVRRTYINVHTLFYDVTYIYNIYSTRTLYGYN